MKQKLIDVLETFCPQDVYLQGSMNPADAYPSEFITFFTTQTEDIAHYDNAVQTVGWRFAVIYYSDDPTKVNTKPFEIAAALKAAGFIQQGKGSDVLSDEHTHTGWAMDFIYPEKI
jgi:hypothetical protein